MGAIEFALVLLSVVCAAAAALGFAVQRVSLLAAAVFFALLAWLLMLIPLT